MKKLIKLSQNGCRPCVLVGNYLDEKNVSYEEINVSIDREAIDKYAIMSTPVTVLLDGDKEIGRVNGFNPDDLEDLISKL